MSDPMLLLNRAMGWLSGHLLGMLAYTILSPAVVSYAVMILGTLGFWLVAGGINEEGGLARIFLMNVLTIAEGEGGGWVWREDLPFERNALRVFGALGFVGWSLELVLSPFRQAPDEPPTLLERVKRLLLRQGVFTAVLSVALLTAVLLIPRGATDEGPFVLWVLRAGATAAGMGAVLFAAGTC